MSSAQRIRFLGHTDQGRRPDGVQAIVARGHAYVGPMFSDGITVVDVADPRTPKPVQFTACPPNTRASPIQVHDGLLLAVNAANVWALQQYESSTKKSRIILAARWRTASASGSADLPLACACSISPIRQHRVR